MVKICSRPNMMAASSDEEAENELRSLYGIEKVQADVNGFGAVVIAMNVVGKFVEDYLLPIRGIRGGSFTQNSPVVKSALVGVVKSKNDIKWQKNHLCFAKKWQEENATRTNFACPNATYWQ